jgi:hypothetical protein
LDISNPSNPQVMSTLLPKGGIIAQYGDFVYLGVTQIIIQAKTATLSHNIEIINVADPKNPLVVGKYDLFEFTGEPPKSPAGEESKDLQESRDSGLLIPVLAGYDKYLLAFPDFRLTSLMVKPPPTLEVIDLSDPAQPNKVGTLISDPGFTGNSVISGNYAYVLRFRVVGKELKYAVEIIDLSDPANPSIKGEYDSDKPLENIAVSGEYMLLIESEGEGKTENLLIFRIEG